jgi:hypothetical protein
VIAKSSNWFLGSSPIAPLKLGNLGRYGGIHVAAILWVKDYLNIWEKEGLNEAHASFIGSGFWIG